jgi:hypothetical protein
MIFPGFQTGKWPFTDEFDFFSIPYLLIWPIPQLKSSIKCVLLTNVIVKVILLLMPNIKKIKWLTPKLEILSRVTPEEFVLAGCKQQQSGTSLLPGTLVQMCGADVSGNCAACQSRGQS